MGIRVTRCHWVSHWLPSTSSGSCRSCKRGTTQTEIQRVGEVDLDPSGDKVDHHLASFPATIDPTDQTPPESDYEGGREVYTVGQGEQPTEKTAEEITRDARRKSHECSGYSRRLTMESGKMACRMILGHPMMGLVLALPRGDTA
jgi:hypothetical protein